MSDRCWECGSMDSACHQCVVEPLIDALEFYGQHHYGCPARIAGVTERDPCTCGLDAAIARVRGPEPAGDTSGGISATRALMEASNLQKMVDPWHRGPEKRVSE